VVRVARWVGAVALAVMAGVAVSFVAELLRRPHDGAYAAPAPAHGPRAAWPGS